MQRGEKEKLITDDSFQPPQINVFFFLLQSSLKQNLACLMADAISSGKEVSIQARIRQEQARDYLAKLHAFRPCGSEEAEYTLCSIFSYI